MDIRLVDTTLRDGEQMPGVRFGVVQKLDIARRLAKTGIDVLEAGFPAASKGDFDAVQAIAAASANGELGTMRVSALARLMQSDIDTTARAFGSLKNARLHVFIATSDVHLEAKLKITRVECLERIRTWISYAKGLGAFGEIEFSAEDATRTDPVFLFETYRAAAESGADVLNVPDTVGYTTPHEFARLITEIRQNVPGDYEISVHCHDDLGMAVANSLSAVEAGATQIECCVNGLGERAGNASMEEIVMALTVRHDAIRQNGETLTCGVHTKEITETSRLVASLAGVPVAPNKAVVGANAFAHASGIHQHGVMAARQTYEIMDPADVGLNSNTIVLGKLSGRHAFAERVAQLGYSLDQAGVDHTFARFKEIAAKKPVMADEDIRAIIGEYLDSLEGRYMLHTFQIQSGNQIKAMALVSLHVKDGTEEGHIETEAAPGEGPVDAAFHAINRLSGAESVELLSYNITAVTEGADALGEAKVKIRGEDGTTYSGRGVSTDIIKASIKAYLGAINKWRECADTKKV